LEPHQELFPVTVGQIHNLRNGGAGAIKLLKEMNFLRHRLPDRFFQHLRQKLALSGEIPHAKT
jgi:hypothetical protein